MRITHLLDTNIVSDLVRRPRGVVRDRIAEIGPDAVGVNVIVAAELRYGCIKKGSSALTKQVDQILNAINILPLEAGLEHHYARIRRDLDIRGTPIGPNDFLIAAHVVQLNCCLVTANREEFGRVPELRVENWLE